MENYLFIIPNHQMECNQPDLFNGGSWSLEEDLAYAIFVDIHKKFMTSKKKMREILFYDKLPMFIGTRSYTQCRSHHQKVFQKFKYISKIVQNFKIQVDINNYKTKYEEGLQKMKRINLQLETKSTTNSTLPIAQTPLPIPAPAMAQLTPTFEITYPLNPLGYYANNWGWINLDQSINSSGIPAFMTF